MLGRNSRNDSANDEVTGPGHTKQGGSNTHNGQRGTVSPVAHVSAHHPASTRQDTAAGCLRGCCNNLR